MYESSGMWSHVSHVGVEEYCAAQKGHVSIVGESIEECGSRVASRPIKKGQGPRRVPEKKLFVQFQGQSEI